jgi:Holliday junction resolvase-like predicted endonuclease
MGKLGCKSTYLVVMKAISFSDEDVNGGIQADYPSKNELIIQTAQEYTGSFVTAMADCRSDCVKLLPTRFSGAVLHQVIVEFMIFGLREGPRPLFD